MHGETVKFNIHLYVKYKRKLDYTVFNPVNCKSIINYYLSLMSLLQVSTSARLSSRCIKKVDRYYKFCPKCVCIVKIV